MTEPDSDLLVRARSGDAEAGDILERALREPLRRFCVGYLGHADAADDAVQDVLAKALTSSECPDNLRVWLYTIARNHCLNVLRARARRKDDGTLPSGTLPGRTRTGFLTRLVRQEELEAVDRAFQALPSTTREALRLRYADDLSRAEIAKIIDLPESIVKSRLFEGMKQLRSRLDA